LINLNILFDNLTKIVILFLYFIKIIMTKLNLLEINYLEAELFGVPTQNGKMGGLLSKDLPFSLKFRLNSKVVPILEKASPLIKEKTVSLAIENGAESISEGYQFKTDDNGIPLDIEAFNLFQVALNKYLITEEIEIDFTFKLSLFEGLKDSLSYPITFKLIEDDL